jgi:Fungal Zn(2)-Cys(6) binuclear cluster domain
MCPEAADPVDGCAGFKEKTPHVNGHDAVEHGSPQDSPDGSPTALEHEDDTSRSTAAPLQKRRRVTRACDECRRKKIKCDGKQPCTHCTVYSYGK